MSAGAINGWSGARRAAAITALMATTAVACVLQPTSAFSQASLASAESRAYAIAAGPLAQALNRFADVSQLQLVYSSGTTRGLRTDGVSGAYTPQQALAQLLAGSGLTYRFTGGSSVTIQRPVAATGVSAAPAGAVPLDTIEVQAARDGTVGYVATRATAGSKTSTPLIETPRSISVVTRAELDDRGVTSLPEAVRYTAGVTTGGYGFDPRFDQIFVRGFSTTTLGDFRDGLKQFPAGFTTFRTEPYELQSIEIIKGPASVLYGQGVPGGLIDRRSKLPTDYTIREAVAQIGGYGRLQGAFDLGGPANPDKTMLYRIVALGRIGDTNFDIADQRALLAPSFTWRPNAATSLTVYGRFQQDESDSSVAALNRNGEVLKLRASDPRYDYLKQKQGQIGYDFEHKFDQVFAFRQKLRYGFIEADSRYLTGSFASAASPIYNRGAAAVGDRLASFQIDNNLEANVDTGPMRHKLLLGLNYDYNLWHFGYGYSGVVPAYALNILNPVYGIDGPTPAYTTRSREKQSQIGLYAQDQISFGNWRVALSARQDWADRTQTNMVTKAITGVRKDEAFTYSAGLLYLFDNGLAPYASYSTSFQPVTSRSLDGSILAPSEGEQLEAGLKYQPPDGRFSLTASVYQLTEKNAPKLAGYTNGLAYYASIGEVRVRGVELEARGRLTEEFDITAAYAFSDAEIVKTTVASELRKVPAVTPRHTASVWGNYTMRSGPLAGFGGGVGVRYIGSTFGNNANTMRNDAYALADAALRYDLSQVNRQLAGVSVSVNATNLFNKQPAICNSGYCYLAQGRTILGSIKYQW